MMWKFLWHEIFSLHFIIVWKDFYRIKFYFNWHFYTWNTNEQKTKNFHGKYLLLLNFLNDANILLDEGLRTLSTEKTYSWTS